MKLNSTELSSYRTTKDQYLVKIPKVSNPIDISNTPMGSFTLSNSTDKEVTSGVIVSADADHQNDVNKECIIPIEGSIQLDQFIEVDESDKFEYRLIQSKNVFLIKL